MKMLLNLLARGVVLLFWLGVGAALAGLLPERLNTLLPPCGLVVLLMHWAQAGMIRRACAPHFAVSRGEYWQIVLFGVFATGRIREQLRQIAERAS